MSINDSRRIARAANSVDRKTPSGGCVPVDSDRRPVRPGVQSDSVTACW